QFGKWHGRPGRESHARCARHGRLNRNTCPGGNLMVDTRKPAMCPMVGWYDPIQLGRTAADVAVSTLFGKNADYRLMEGLATPDGDDIWEKAGGKRPDENGVYSFDDADAIWIDYVADTGDGWNSTYAVAYSVGREALEIDGAGKLPRGQVLIFGGDEVYPV